MAILSVVWHLKRAHDSFVKSPRSMSSRAWDRISAQVNVNASGLSLKNVTTSSWEWRVCRFCRRRGAVEDEAHVLLGCDNGRLTMLREVSPLLVFRLEPPMRRLRGTLESVQSLRPMVCKRQSLNVVGNSEHLRGDGASCGDAGSTRWC